MRKRMNLNRAIYALGICGLLVTAASSSAQLNSAPEVTNVIAVQNDGVIEVTYDLFDADGDLLDVRAEATLTDGSGNTPVPCVTVTGEIGPGQIPGTGKSFIWDAGEDGLGSFVGSCVVRVIADDGNVEYVLIPAGTFMMGSPTDENGRYTDETQHQVTLTHDFWMQSTEVTNQQYANLAQWAFDNGYCTATTSSLRDALDGSTLELLDLDGDCEISFSEGVFSVDTGKENYPVLEVTWYGSVAYCDWLSLQQGLPRAYSHGTWQCNAHDPYNAAGYRLPTEAEWEYACRAGTPTPFNTGDCLDAGTEANYNGGSPYTGCPSGPYVGWTVPVGIYPANVFGFYDMHGNLLEWCNDWYDAYGGTVTDPVGLSTGDSRVKRGGNWYYLAQYCRSAYRNYSYQSSSSRFIGFRSVRSAE
jgi:formylglycine-generating enzyme required for sulfatase activity